MKHSNPGRGIRLHGNVYRLEYKPKGQARVYVNLETSDFAEAVRLAAEVRRHPQLAPSTGGLTEEIKRFIAYKLRVKEYTRHTARTKEAKLMLLTRALPVSATAANVTTKQIQAWHDTLVDAGNASSTIHGYLMTARAFFRWSIEVAKLRRSNPLDGVKAIKLAKRARQDFCIFAQRDQLIADCEDDELKFILFCGFHAGLRFNEIVQAVPWWFDLPHMRLDLRKTPTMNFKDGEERSVPLTRQFRAFLDAYGLRAPFMIAPDVEQGKWLYRYDFRAKFEGFMKTRGWCCSQLYRFRPVAAPDGHDNRKKLPLITTCPKCGQEGKCFGDWLTPHTMRHTFASLLVTAGESIYKVAVWMGDDVQTVQDHYGHLAPDLGGIEKAFSDRAQL